MRLAERELAFAAQLLDGAAALEARSLARRVRRLRRVIALAASDGDERRAAS